MGRVLLMRGGMLESENRFRRAVFSMSSEDNINSWYMSPTGTSLHGDLAVMEMTYKSKRSEMPSSEPQTQTTTANTTPVSKRYSSAYTFHGGTAPSETYIRPQGNGDIHSPHQVLLDNQLQEMRESIVYLRERFAERYSIDVEKRLIQRHWRDVALIFDRFFFALYILLIVVSLIFLFPRPSKSDRE